MALVLIGGVQVLVSNLNNSSLLCCFVIMDLIFVVFIFCLLNYVVACKTVYKKLLLHFLRIVLVFM